MLAVSLKGLAARKLRVALTAIAVALGVALIAGTYVLTDTINSSFDRIFQTATKGTDVSITPTDALGDSGDDSSAQQSVPVPVLRKVQGLPDVAQAAGAIFSEGAIFDARGKRLGVGGAPSFIASTMPSRFESFSYVRGGPPHGPGEVALDSSSAGRAGIAVGDTIQVVGRAPKTSYRVVGLAEFAGVSSFGGTAIAVLTLPEARRVTGNAHGFDSIDVAATAGTTPQELKGEVREALPPSVTVRTGEQEATRQSEDIRNGLSFFRTALLAFAGIALFVGAFIIFNTFSITVAQRTREFALLRTLGASRRQVLRSVLAETFLLGATGAVVGLGAGIGLAPGLRALFRSFGVDLPSQGTIVEPRTIVVSLLVGTIVTVLSGLFPALRATRVPPVAAMREGAVLPQGRGHRLVTPLAGLLIVGGGAALAAGLSGSGGVGLVGFGGAAIFVGVALLSPRFVKPIAAVVGAPIERARGITGRLARENTIRQPGRTAVTAAALMIGVTLVAFVSIFASGAKTSIANAVDAAVVPGTLIVQNTNGFGTVPRGAAEAVARVPGVTTVSPIGFTRGKAPSLGKVSFTSVDPASFARVYDARWKEGSQAVLAGLGGGGAIASKGFASDHGLRVGSTLRVLTATGQRVPLTVEGIVDDRGRLLADLTITQALAASAFGERDIALAFAGVAPADAARVKGQVDRILKARYPVAEAQTLQQFKDDQAGQVDQLLNLIYVLLSLAVIVSLFGIVNTLALSIHERTRELGMLRAIGTTRRQVKRMVRYEAVITSLIGAVLGVILGVLLAVAVTQPLKDDGFVLSFPVATLIVLLVLAIVAGALAAIGPARRASRLDVLDALAYE